MVQLDGGPGLELEALKSPGMPGPRTGLANVVYSYITQYNINYAASMPNQR